MISDAITQLWSAKKFDFLLLTISLITKSNIRIRSSLNNLLWSSRKSFRKTAINNAFKRLHLAIRPIKWACFNTVKQCIEAFGFNQMNNNILRCWLPNFPKNCIIWTIKTSVHRSDLFLTQVTVSHRHAISFVYFVMTQLVVSVRSTSQSSINYSTFNRKQFHKT